MRIRGACLDVEKSQPPYFCCGYLVSSYYPFVYLSWIWPSSPRAQPKSVRWVCRANRLRPLVT